MRKSLFGLSAAITLATVFSSPMLLAQNSSPYWSLAGNSNATPASKFGTTNNVSLRFYTKNAQRMIIDSAAGFVGIGTTTPTERLYVNSASGANAFRAQVNGSTKLLVHSNGGVAVGTGPTPPSNGLFAPGNTGIGTSVPENKLHVFKGSAGSVTGYYLAPLIVENSSHSYINILAPDASETGILFGKPANVGSGEIKYNNASTPNGLQFRTNGAITQMVLTDAGNLGVGKTDPSARLYVKNNDLNNNYGAGIIVETAGSAVTAVAIAGNENIAYGLEARASGTAGGRYAVYGNASGGAFNAAGYFNGDVYAISYKNICDRKFKTDITALKNSLQQLMSLKPSSYLFKKTDYAKMELPAGKQIGLIADEVKQVLPELVNEAVHPAEYGKDRTEVVNPEIKYESVNYIGLIPVLIASIQEQQRQIEELKEIVKQLSGERNFNTGSNSVILEQNKPNPFNKSTTIRYSFPQGSKGQINIYDQTGKLVKSLNANESGQSELSRYNLASGTYTYALIINGKALSKQMLVIK